MTRILPLLVLVASLACARRGELAPVAPDCRATALRDAGNAAVVHSAHWIFGGDHIDAAELDAWCAGVGRPHIETVRAPREVEGIDSLLVVTWNVHIGAGDLRSFVHDLRAGRHTGGEPPRHFVLLLQEALRTGGAPPVARRDARWAYRVSNRSPTGRIDVIEVARELGLHVAYVPSMRNGNPARDPAEDRGNAILSTLPLSAPVFIELPLERHRRVAIQARVEGRTSDGADWMLHVASLHLDNRSRPDRLLAWFGDARVRQVRALVRTMGDDAPLVIGGDLNNWSIPAFDRAPRLLRASFPDIPEGVGHTLTMLGVLRRQVDHLVARLPTGTARAPHSLPARYGSDHHPVLAWVLPGSNLSVFSPD